MPIMIPDPIPSSASNAERSIFETFKSVAQRNWEVLYGIEISSGAASTKPVKIDFVVFIPNQLCVICIFVAPPISSEPHRFEGISSNDLNSAKSIIKDLRNLYAGTHFYPNSPLSLGYAVVLPDLDSSELKITIPDPDRGIISDPLDNLETTLKDYARTLNPELWEDLDESYPEIDWNTWQKSWDEAQLALDKLRSDLVSTGGTISIISTMFHDNLETHRPQLLRLTNNQLEVLQLAGCQLPSAISTELDDQITISDEIKKYDRVVVDGAAGTGKTVLAIGNRGDSFYEAGKTVGLLCSNPYLSRRFTSWAENTLW